MSSAQFFPARAVIEHADIEKGMEVIDIGCADGHISLAAARRVGPTGTVTAIDTHDASIAALRATVRDVGFSNVNPTLGDFTRGTDLAASSVDRALLVNVYHGFVANGEATGALEELTRILRVGAKSVFIEFSADRTVPGPPLEVRVSADDIRTDAEAFGLRPIHDFVIGSYHYGCVLEYRSTTDTDTDTDTDNDTDNDDNLI